jgi:hypothetical protein
MAKKNLSRRRPASFPRKAKRKSKTCGSISLRGDWPQERLNINGQHFDERMNWTLADIHRLFPTPRIDLPELVHGKA